MEVSSADCGGIVSAGEYPFRDGHLIVTPYQIEIWRADPDTIFLAAPSRLSRALKLYVLTGRRRRPSAMPAGTIKATASDAGTSLR